VYSAERVNHHIHIYKALGFEEQAFKVGLIKGIEELTRL